jgi:hypothetical protein
MALRFAVVAAGVLAAGCTAVGAPILEGAFLHTPDDWETLPPAERHARGWRWHRHGVEYANSAARREDARLLATGTRRAAEGLEICASALADPAAQQGLREVAAGYRLLERQARSGRLFRPDARLDDLEERAWAFRPGAVVLIAAPAPGPVSPSAPTPAAPGSAVTGTIVRKRVDVTAGPAGETTAWILTVLQKGGAQVDVAVAEATWRAAVIGEAYPAPEEAR